MLKLEKVSMSKEEWKAHICEPCPKCLPTMTCIPEG